MNFLLIFRGKDVLQHWIFLKSSHATHLCYRLTCVVRRVQVSSKPFEIVIVEVKSSARFGEEILRSTR